MRGLVSILTLLPLVLSTTPEINESALIPPSVEKDLPTEPLPEAEEIVPGKYIIWSNSSSGLYKRSRDDDIGEIIRVGDFEATIVEGMDGARMHIPEDVEMIPVRTIRASSWSTYAPWNLRVRIHLFHGDLMSPGVESC